MDLENFAKLRGLNQAYIASNSGFIDHLLNSEQGAEIRKTVFTKRLQFDTTPELYAEVENMCQLLGCSKREFLELAARIPLLPAVKEYPLEEANRALRELKQHRVRGAKVLRVSV